MTSPGPGHQGQNGLKSATRGCPAVGLSVIAGSALLALVPLVALSTTLSGEVGPTRLDRWFDERWSPLLRAWPVPWLGLIALGQPLVMTILAAALGVACWWDGRPRTGAWAFGSPMLALLLSDLVLKPVVARRREGNLDLTFPSGHAAMLLAVALVVLLLLRRECVLGRRLASPVEPAVVAGTAVCDGRRRDPVCDCGRHPAVALRDRRDRQRRSRLLRRGRRPTMGRHITISRSGLRGRPCGYASEETT